VFLPFLFCGKVRGVLVLDLLLKVWLNSAVSLSGSGLFFFGKLFTASSISLLVIDLFR
jgi:hypothetical protein